MTLKEYVDNILKISIRAAARSGGFAEENFRLWYHKKARPRDDEEMKRLYLWSDRHVAPNDFYDLPAADVVTVAQHSVDEGASSSLSPCSGAGISKACPGHGIDLSFARAAV